VKFANTIKEINKIIKVSNEQLLTTNNASKHVYHFGGKHTIVFLGS